MTDAYLDDCDTRYNPDLRLLGLTWNGPGYHTRVPNGTWAHPTRESLDYALALLQSGTPAHTARAADIIRAVLALQETDPTAKTYGIWPWLGEEPLAQMNPPDWNWADFCGARLVQMLIDHPTLLPDDLAAAMRVALGHAAWSIFRRNVGPGYTNIAIMGAGVALTAGELLGEARLVEYGRTRLRRFLEHTEYHGGLNEYNSPTYTLIVVHECERILHLARDPQARADTEAIRRIAWETIAEHYHTPTAQWAGPHSRTYGDRLDAGTAEYLSVQTGIAVPPHPLAAPKTRTGPTHIPALPCPPDLAARFAVLPQPELEIRRRFIRGVDEAASIWGTTWMNGDACLGSVNWESLWTQRRPLLGYWRTPEDPAIVLRLRCLKDGRDFASVGVRTAQHGPRVLAGFGLLTNRGDYHLHLDRPPDGRFAVQDLRVRLELCGNGVVGRQLGPQRFELAAGVWRVVVHTPPGSFAGRAVQWELTDIDGGMALDGICLPGEPGFFDPATSDPVRLILGMELLSNDTQPSSAPQVRETADALTVEWGDPGFHLDVPLRAEAYPF